MIVTINVPKNKLRGIFFCGFFISPAMNVTLFHASEEKRELMIVAPNAPSSAKPVKATVVIELSLLTIVCFADHMS